MLNEVFLANIKTFSGNVQTMISLNGRTNWINIKLDKRYQEIGKYDSEVVLSLCQENNYPKNSWVYWIETRAGRLHHANKTLLYTNFITADESLSWHPVPQSISDLIIFNKGSAVLGINKMSKDILLSFDLANSWQKIQLFEQNLKILSSVYEGEHQIEFVFLVATNDKKINGYF
ncbi:hypothetical protein MXB_1090 [Myxobolus squamalis]|nr:hypothetical protein MXB_1090 [Myxobolus squamalis]